MLCFSSQENYPGMGIHLEIIAILWISDSKMYSVIYQIEIYLVDSIIRPSNNWSLYVGLYFI